MDNLYTVFVNRIEEIKKRTSIVDIDGEYSYEDLLNLVAKIQQKILKCGVLPGDKIGILCNKDIYWVASFLAIWSMDAIAVTLSVRDSKEQIQERMKQVRCFYTLTNDEKMNFKGTIFIKQLDEEETIQPIKAFNYSSDISCIMFTSGSTGKPKPVAIGHKNILNLIDNKTFEFIDKTTILLQTGAANFDAIHFELWCPLFKGGKVLLFSENTILNFDKFNSIVSKHSPNLMWITSPLFTNMVQSGKFAIEQINNLVVGGDKLNLKAIQKIYSENSNIQIFNGYGPTETTTFATFYPIPKSISEEDIPLGEPLENVKIQIENSNGEVCAINEEGEIVIYGLGVAYGGYLGEDNSKGFIKYDDKFIGYRSGDIGKVTEDSLIHYIGRKDNQVKVNGYRINVNQVEGIFLNITGVKNVVVYADNTNEQVELKAVVQLDSNISKSIDEIIREFQKLKPSHIILTSIRAIEEIPLKNNGKIDINGIKKYFNSNLTETNQRTLEEIHDSVKTIICETLTEKNIDDDDSFFMYGIDSLKAALISIKIQDKLIVNTTVWDILDNDTIKDLSDYIMSKLSEKSISTKGVIFEEKKVNKIQKPYFLDFLRDRNSTKYNIPLLLDLPIDIDIDCLSNVLVNVVNKIQSLHFNFIEKNGEFFQKKRLELLTKIPIYETLPTKKDWIHPFDLENECLYRVAIVNERHPKLLLDFHHIVMDGKMLKNFLSQVVSEYEGNIGGRKLKNFSSRGSEDILYNQEDINTLKTKVQHYQKNQGVLPIDFPCNRVENSKSGVVQSRLDSRIWNLFKQKSAELKVTQSILLTAAFSLFLHLVTDSDEVIFNIPVNCDYLDEDNLYMNTTTVLQTSTINKTVAFSEYISEFSKNYRNNIQLNIPAYFMGNYTSNLDYNGGIYSTDTLFSYHSELELEIDWFGERTNIRPCCPGQSMLPLNFQVFETKNTLLIELEYEAALFTKSSIDFYLNLFVEIIKEFNMISKNDIIKKIMEYKLMSLI